MCYGWLSKGATNGDGDGGEAADWNWFTENEGERVGFDNERD